MKKVLAMLLAVMMVASLLAGCGGDKPTEAPKTETPAETPKTEGTKAEASKDGVPTLTWYQVGGGQPKDIDAWNAIVNPYLEEKIGCHLNLQVVGWGDWADRRKMLVQTNDDYDIIFTNMADYVNNINMGAFADLTEMVKETPGITDLIPEDYLKACMVDGKLYGIPAYKDSSMTNFFTWTKEDVEAYYPDWANVHTLADADAAMYALKEGTGTTPLMMGKDGVSCIVPNLYDNFGTGLAAIGVSYFDGSNKVVATFEQEDVMEQLRLVHKWYNDGIINSDANTLDFFQGMCSVGFAQGWPAASVGWGAGRGAEVVVSQYGETVLSNDTVQGSIACINNSSANKELALKFLELVNTDTKLRDMLAYGIEGTHFEYVEEDGIQKVNRLSMDWTAAAYTQGSTMVMTQEAGTLGDPREEIRYQNEHAVASPALGFCFDVTNVRDQIAACVATFEDYKSLLYTGAADPDEIVPQMMEAMRADGFDDIVAEAQAQLDAFLAG